MIGHGRLPRVGPDRSRALGLSLALLLLVMPAQAEDGFAPAVAAALDDASAAIVQGDFAAAIEAYQQADEASGGRCLVCQAGLAMAYNRKGHYERAAQAASKALGLAEEPVHKRAAHVELGFALFQDSRGSDLSELDQAIEHFQAALRYQEGTDEVTLLLGHALLARATHFKTPDEDGREMLYELVSLMRAFLAADPDRPGSDRALSLLCGAPDCVPATYVDTERSSVPPDEAHVRHVQKNEDVRPPRRTSTVAPPYTETARRARVEGFVILQSIIDTEGRIRKVRVLRGLPLGLTEAAVAAVRQWRFKPATRDGEPVEVYYNLTTSFRLQ